MNVLVFKPYITEDIRILIELFYAGFLYYIIWSFTGYMLKRLRRYSNEV